MSQLHLKTIIDQVKKFDETNKEGQGFNHLIEIYPKLKERIFVELQIRKLLVALAHTFLDLIYFAVVANLLENHIFF